jgi:hypothetical protein
MVTNGLRPNKEESAENVKPGYIRIAGVAILKWLVVAGRTSSARRVDGKLILAGRDFKNGPLRILPKQSYTSPFAD